MGATTTIEWTDASWNPWRGCTMVSPGCMNCYAAARDARFEGGQHWGPGAPRVRGQDWSSPYAWNRRAERERRRTRVFCASLADFFDPEVPPEWRADAWRVFRETHMIDWQVLTKRPENIRSMLPPDYSVENYPNVWLGVTVEDQNRADERIPLLLAVPASVRFLSCEPLLGPVDLSDYLRTPSLPKRIVKPHSLPIEYLEVRGIDWVIAGGESGPHARATHPDWIRSLRDQCQRADRVAFFFKQWGEWADPEHTNMPPGAVPSLRGIHWIEPTGGIVDSREKTANAAMMFRFGKKHAGRELDGRFWTQFPCPDKPCPTRSCGQLFGHDSSCKIPGGRSA